MTFRVLGNFMPLPYDLRDFSAVMIGASEKIFQEVFLRRSEPGSLGDARKNFEIRRVCGVEISDHKWPYHMTFELFSDVMIGTSEKTFQEVFLRRSEPGSLGDARKNFEICRVCGVVRSDHKWSYPMTFETSQMG